MKYRIIHGPSDEKPYVVQKQDEKSYFKIWWTIDKFPRQHQAEDYIRTAMARHSKYPVGSVIFEYDEADMVVERLKSQEKSNLAVEGAQMSNVTSAMAMAPAVSKDYIRKMAGLNGK